MPMRPPRACPRCGALVTADRCPHCTADRDRARPNVAVRAWYRTPRWKLLRADVIRDAASTCAVCRHVVQRLDVDHVEPHGGDVGRFWDRANLQALCKPCHTTKTRRGA